MDKNPKRVRDLVRTRSEPRRPTRPLVSLRAAVILVIAGLLAAWTGSPVIFLIAVAILNRVIE